MRFDVVTLFPDFFSAFAEMGVVGQAYQKGLLQLHTLNPRKFTTDRHHTVDDRPFGGGDGMVLKAEPLIQAVDEIQSQGAAGPVILLSAQGRKLNYQWVRELAEQQSQVTLVCGRYGGVDQRFVNLRVDEEISVGDYILSGGELGAAVIMDAVARWIPGVLGDADSASEDSFYRGGLECPQFTRPREVLGQSVPEVFMSGDHKQVQFYQQMAGIFWTSERRPDLLSHFSQEQIEASKKWWAALSDQEREVLGLDVRIKS